MVFSVPCNKNTWTDSKFNLSMFKHAHRNSDNESTFLSHHYRPQRSRGKVMFLPVSVILFTGGGLPHCMLGYTPPAGPKAGTPLGSGHPLGTNTPQEQTPPGTRPPWEQASDPPGADPSQTRHPPPGADPLPVQCILGDTGNKQAVRILLQCNLVYMYIYTE